MEEAIHIPTKISDHYGIPTERQLRLKKGKVDEMQDTERKTSKKYVAMMRSQKEAHFWGYQDCEDTQKPLVLQFLVGYL